LNITIIIKVPLTESHLPFMLSDSSRLQIQSHYPLTSDVLSGWISSNKTVRRSDRRSYKRIMRLSSLEAWICSHFPFVILGLSFVWVKHLHT